MNRTTGAEPTALSIAARVSWERNRAAMGEIRGKERREANVGDGRAACRNACVCFRLGFVGLRGRRRYEPTIGVV
jgi:hypothetical protein